MTEIFTGNFTQQEPILDESIAAAVAVMQHGRLHRYNEAAGEVSETALLEQEFAGQMGARYCLAVASGGYALATALRALGVKPGDRVLTNAFTLAPVPGAIASVGAVPVFVGVTEGLVIDLDDLAAKADQADVLMLSHMRGHIVDMDALMDMAQAHDLKVIEDCAHTMGAKWGDTWSGRSGIIGCYSCQTYKHVNSGEGGLLICEDDEIMARAIMLCASSRHNAQLGMIAIMSWTRGLPRLQASRVSSGRSKKNLLPPPISSYCSIGHRRRSVLFWRAVWPAGWSLNGLGPQIRSGSPAVMTVGPMRPAVPCPRVIVFCTV